MANVPGSQLPSPIPADQLQRIQAALQTLETDLVPHLVGLRPGDRRKLFKMGDKTVAFVEKTLDYARANPQFRPSFVAIDDFANDFDNVAGMQDLQRSLSKIADLVDDSLVLSGSAALTAALACYQSMKTAAKMNMPGAQTIVDDLSVRFAARNAKAPAPAPQPAARPAPDTSPA